MTARAYGQALVGETETPWGPVRGPRTPMRSPPTRCSATTRSRCWSRPPRGAGAGVFLLVRTSNPGAARLQDATLGDRPLHEELAALVAESASELAGESGLSGRGRRGRRDGARSTSAGCGS